MKKKKRLLIFVLIITFVVFIFMGISFAAYRNGKGSVAGNNAVNVVLTPVQKLFSAVGGKIDDFFTYRRDLKTYKEDNLELMAEVDSLKAQNRELDLYKSENERLRSLLDLKAADTKNKMVYCEVVSKDPGNWFNVFTIDKGSSSGIVKDDVVITNKGLVGKITEVGTSWAKVTTIIDPDSSVGAMIERNGETALVDGDVTLGDQGKCRLDYIKSDISIVSGDTIETSGLGGIYPEGLFIGTVAEIKNDSSGYTRYAVIDTAVDFGKIREVAVIRSSAE